MHKDDKERVVAELTERLRTSETLLVADYRGLTNSEIDELRTKMIAAGARFSVVKNTLTRRAAEAAGADSLLALLEGPTAIAFLEADGDPVAVAKALADTARETHVLEVRGGVMQGVTISAEQVEELAKLPPVDVVRAQVLGAVTAPLTTIVGLFSAPLRDLVGLIDARIAQLEEQGDTSGVEAVAVAPEVEAQAPPADEAEPEAETETEVPEAQVATTDEDTTDENTTDEPTPDVAEDSVSQPQAAEPDTTQEEE